LEKTVENIRKLLQNHHQLFQNSIPLIASENITSPAVDEACSCDFSHRYAEGWCRERVYAGCKYIDDIEEMCMDLAKKFFNAKFADVRPISGVVANLALYNAFTSRNNGKMMVMPIPKGGHISHAPMFTKSGMQINGTAGTVRGLEIEYFSFDEQNMNLDIDSSAKIIREFKPELILFGGSVFLFPHPVKELSEVAKEVGAHVAYDGAHVAGLIGSGYFQDPLREGAEAMSLSTHKTLPGPQHGMVVANDKSLVDVLKTASFPALLSNHHLHNVAGLAVALAEMIEFGKEYSGQIIKNAKALGKALYDKGINVLQKENDFTSSHQIVAEISNFEKTVGLGGDIERLLEKANIILNRNLLPWDITQGRHYQNPGGLRIGTSEVTRLGMKEREMDQIAEFMKEVLIDKKDPNSVKEEIKEFRKDFQEVKYCFQTPNEAYKFHKFY
jgi:glycine hydroxymethyltransferase